MSNREAFEQLEDIKDILNDHKIFFNEKEDRYQAEKIIGDDSVYYPSWEITYMNGAWYAWQARVPEGYVVVPKEPTQDQLEYGYRCGSKDAATIYRVMVVAESEK